MAKNKNKQSSTARRKKLQTVKLFVGGPHSYQDHYVIQSATKRKQRKDELLFSIQTTGIQNGATREITLSGLYLCSCLLKKR